MALIYNIEGDFQPMQEYHPNIPNNYNLPIKEEEININIDKDKINWPIRITHIFV